MVAALPPVSTPFIEKWSSAAATSNHTSSSVEFSSITGLYFASAGGGGSTRGSPDIAITFGHA
jgi:hypothetical protein